MIAEEYGQRWLVCDICMTGAAHLGDAEMLERGWVLAVAEPDLDVCPGCDEEID